MDLKLGKDWATPEEPTYYYVDTGSNTFVMYHSSKYSPLPYTDKWWGLQGAGAGTFDFDDWVQDIRYGLRWKIITEEQAKVLISVAGLPFF